MTFTRSAEQILMFLRLLDARTKLSLGITLVINKKVSSPTNFENIFSSSLVLTDGIDSLSMIVILLSNREADNATFRP
jgi:hypothetical protein